MEFLVVPKGTEMLFTVIVHASGIPNPLFLKTLFRKPYILWVKKLCFSHTVGTFWGVITEAVRCTVEHLK